MKKWVYMLLVSMVLSACASIPDTPPSDSIAPTAAVDQPAAGGAPTEKSVDFFDAYSFDKRLSSNLKEGPSTVDVYLRAPATVNAIPERLGKWLTMVDKYGGTVEARNESDAQLRGVATSGASLVVGAVVGLYQAIRSRALYSPVKAYNAIVFYNGSDGVMTRIEFTRKASDS